MILRTSAEFICFFVRFGSNAGRLFGREGDGLFGSLGGSRRGEIFAGKINKDDVQKKRNTVKLGKPGISNL